MMISHPLRSQQMAVSILLALLLYVPASQGQSLPKEMQADQHLLEAQEAYREGNHGQAVEAFKKIESLGVSIPSEFHFFYGSSLAETGDHADALAQLTEYLKQEGRDGRHYQDALRLYGKIERKAAEAESQRKAERRRKIAEAPKYIVDTLNDLPNRTEFIVYDDPDIRYRSEKYESELSIRAKADNCILKLNVRESRIRTSRTHSSTKTFVEGRGTHQQETNQKIDVRNIQYVNISSEEARYRDGVKTLSLKPKDSMGNGLLKAKTFSKSLYSNKESASTEPYLDLEFYGSSIDLDYKARRLSESFITWTNWCKNQ